MPSVLSKEQQSVFSILNNYIHGNAKKKTISYSVILIAVFLLLNYAKNYKKDKNASKVSLKKEKKTSKGTVDFTFFKRLIHLIKIAIPSVYSQEFLDIVLLTFSLWVRTYLSIFLATIKGRIVKGIIKLDFKQFLKGIFNLGLCALPGAFVNSSLNFFTKRLAINFRTRMTKHFLKKLLLFFLFKRYLNELVYYQLANLDQRIPNPDQRLTADIEKWASSLSTLYSNISKPMLDIILYSRKLSTILGWKGPFFIIAWYVLSGFLLRVFSPAFGKMAAIEQKLEGIYIEIKLGEYRSCQSDIVNHAEEIAFFRGEKWEKNRTNNTFERHISQSFAIMHKRLYMGVFDSVLVRYGAFIVGYGVIGLPVFGKSKKQYLETTQRDAGALTRDYVRNSSLLIDLAGAIGRLIISYKNLQLLAGYTTLVYELQEVLADLEQENYLEEEIHEKGNLKNSGIVKISERIKFEQVPIISPNGDVLIKSLDFEINPGISYIIFLGMNCIIIGPNGCGKSSCFRILGQLWPCHGGLVERPAMSQMFYIPQRPYLPHGTLRDQIIYPHSPKDMLLKKKNDDDIKFLLKEAHIDYLIKEKGLDIVQDWNDTLSGGEKQRIAMARLFYHKPTFAILDECTSATSLDVEEIMYKKCKEYEITLFTISHRVSLYQFHDYILKFDGEGGWSFAKIHHQDLLTPGLKNFKGGIH